jgi:hypothetical protein
MEKVLRIIRKDKKEPNSKYWKTKSYEERFWAIEELREQYKAMRNVESGLQRVCNITSRKKS